MEWKPDEIKALRKKQRMSQREFARQLGVSQNLIWYWESGKKPPSKNFQAKLTKLKAMVDNQFDNQNFDNQSDNQSDDQSSDFDTKNATNATTPNGSTKVDTTQNGTGTKQENPKAEQEQPEQQKAEQSKAQQEKRRTSKPNREKKRTYSRDFPEYVKQQIDLVDYISRDETLSKEGNSFRGGHLAVHTSKSNTCLTVDPVKQLWYCFHCNTGGDIFSYVEGRDNCDFPTAIDRLCNEYNIPRPSFSPEQKKEFLRKREEQIELRPLTKECFQYYHDSIDKEHCQYFLDRCISNYTIDNELLGYASGDDCLVKHMIEKHGKEILPKLLKIGMVVKTGSVYHDRYCQRYLFPYWFRNEIVYSIGRRERDDKEFVDSLPDWNKGKYVKHLLNKEGVSDSAIKHVVWGEDIVRASYTVVIAEGIVDALLAKQMERESDQLDYSVISAITTNFSGEQIQRFPELTSHAEKIYIIPDNEESKAGEEGALKTAKILTKGGRNVKIVTIPRQENVDKIDLADFVKNHGGTKETVEDFFKLLEDAVDPITFEMEKIDPEIDKMKLAEKIEPLLKEALSLGKSKDILNMWIDHRLKTRFNLKDKDTRNYQSMLVRLSKEAEQTLAKVEAKERISDAVTPAQEMTEEEKQTAIDYLKDPKLFANIERDLTDAGEIISEDVNKVMLYVIYTTRKFEQPISATLFGQSSSGKSYLVNQVVEFMPPEDRLVLSSASARSIEYLAEVQIKHHVLIVQEIEGASEIMPTLRTLQSEGKLNRLVTITETESGIPEAVQTSKDCPCSVIITTTSDVINEENSTRIFELYVNEDIEQTRKIVKANFERSGIGYLAEQKRREEIKRLHWNVQRLLKPMLISIPYRKKIDFPADRTRHRRDSQRFINLIKGVAFLHQYQKEVKETEDGDKYIEADLRDYTIAYHLADEVLRTTLSELSARAWKVFEVCCHVHYEKTSKINPDTEEEYKGFTRREIKKKAKELKVDIGSYPNFTKQLDSLVETEYLGVLQSGGRGKAFRYEVTFQFEVDKEGNLIIEKPSIENLTTPEELRKKL